MNTDSGYPAARATLRVCGRDLTVMSFHTIAPVSMDASRQWAADLAWLGRQAVDLVGGDLNVTRTNARFGPTLGALGARDAWADCGARRTRTFPSFLPLAQLDHILLGEGLHCRAITTGRHVGSDHLPVRAEIVASDAARSR